MRNTLGAELGVSMGLLDSLAGFVKGALGGAAPSSTAEYGVGIPSLPSGVFPFAFQAMQLERHYWREAGASESTCSGEYYLATPANRDDLAKVTSQLNGLVDLARAKTSSIPAKLHLEPGQIRTQSADRRPSDQERIGLSLFEIGQLTKTGRPAKYPLTVLIIAGESHGSINYLADGKPGKAQVVLWRNHVGYVIDAKSIRGQLDIAYVFELSGDGRNRIYDYRGAQS